MNKKPAARVPCLQWFPLQAKSWTTSRFHHAWMHDTGVIAPPTTTTTTTTTTDNNTNNINDNSTDHRGFAPARICRRSAAAVSPWPNIYIYIYIYIYTYLYMLSSSRKPSGRFSFFHLWFPSSTSSKVFLLWFPSLVFSMVSVVAGNISFVLFLLYGFRRCFFLLLWFPSWQEDVFVWFPSPDFRWILPSQKDSTC